jgi:putative ABC transport system substrate-binding protein
MRALGYVEGKNLEIEWRFGADDAELARMASELVGLRVGVIVVVTAGASLVAKRATTTIPIVMTGSADPVGSGLVDSLARPGGNVTGLTSANPELAAKRLELLREIVPTASVVATLRDASMIAGAPIFAQARDAIAAAGLRLVALDVRTADQLQGAFATARAERVDAMLVLQDGFTVNAAARIAEVASRSGLPAVYAERVYAEAGGLVSYGPDVLALFREAATYVDRILKGRNPADLAVQSPSTFELIVNMRAATASRIAIPRSVLDRATDVIR